MSIFLMNRNYFLKKGVTDPEQKRIIGDQFVKSFDRIAGEFGNFKFLGQGTLYPISLKVELVQASRRM